MASKKSEVSISTQAQQLQGIAGRGIQHIMGDTKSLIREFHGTKMPEQASAQLREFKNSATLYEWTEAVKFSVAKARLRGAALKRLMSKSTELKDFQTLETAFQTTFLLARSVTKKLSIMTTHEQNL